METASPNPSLLLDEQETKAAAGARPLPDTICFLGGHTTPLLTLQAAPAQRRAVRRNMHSYRRARKASLAAKLDAIYPLPPPGTAAALAATLRSPAASPVDRLRFAAEEARRARGEAEALAARARRTTPSAFAADAAELPGDWRVREASVCVDATLRRASRAAPSPSS